MTARLLDALEVQLGLALRQDAQRVGVTESTARVLLAFEGLEILPMAAMAERLGREPSTATRFVDRAEADGLVLRVAGEQDRRSRLVRLAPKGEDLRRTLLEVRLARARALENAVAATIGLGVDQLEWLLQALVAAGQRRPPG